MSAASPAVELSGIARRFGSRWVLKGADLVVGSSHRGSGGRIVLGGVSDRVIHAAPCAVLVDGRSILSCLMLGLDAEGREVKTIEGMAQGAELHPLQQTFADLGAAQCGYCTPGFLLVAEELLKKTPNPSRAEIQEALSGNLCRCTGYLKIYEAVELAAQQIRVNKKL